MRGSVAVVVSLFALTFGSATGTAQPTQLAVTVKSVDAGSFPRIILHVQVVDAAGRPLTGLQNDDFQVFDHGERVAPKLSLIPIGEGAGIAVVLAIDVSGSMQGPPIEAAEEGAGGFLRSLSPFDQAGVVAFGDRVRTLVPLGTSRPKVPSLTATDATTHLYDGIIDAARMVSRASVDRKAVVLLTDGKDEGSKFALRQVINRLPPDVTVHAIGLRSPSFDPTSIREVTRRSAGTYREAVGPSELSDLYQEVARELRSEYLISYEATVQPEAVRDVVVTVDAEDVSASATATYSPPSVAAEATEQDESSVPWQWLLVAGGAMAIALTILAYAIGRRSSRRSKAGEPASMDPVYGPVAGAVLVSGAARFPLATEEIVIGRDPGAAIQLEDPLVSRVHARVVRQGEDHWVIEDLGSVNGTFVNGEAIGVASLSTGDQVRLGETEFEFQERGDG